MTIPIHSDFIHLHNHTEYSLLDGACRIKDMIMASLQDKMEAMAITDHGNLFGSIEFYKQTLEAGIRPIIGMESYICDDMTIKKSGPRSQSSSHHLTLLVRNMDGYKNLVKISSVSHLEGFYYKPRVDKKYLKEHSKGLIGMSGCLKGEIPDLLVQDHYEQARVKALEYADMFEPGEFYLELMDHSIPEEHKANDQLIKLSRDINLPLVATNDTHFLKKEHAEAHEVLLCIQTNKTLNDPNRFRFTTDEVYFKTQAEMITLFDYIPEAIENTVKIAQKCALEMKFRNYLLPSFPLPQGYDQAMDYLHHLASQGLNRRYSHVTPGIRERFDYELSVIQKMGFASYFLIVWDFIHYAKEHRIPVGPGRGSAAGSVIAYALGITDLDPIKYDLMFERFLNPERVSMPDIDVDFCYKKREQVINYVKSKYGVKNVCQIITFGRMMGRGAIKDVGRVMGLSYNEVDKIAKLVPEDRSGKTPLHQIIQDSEEIRQISQNDTRIKKLLDLAIQLEGLPRQPGKHPAGVVIAPTPLTNYVALYNGKEGITTQIDMKYLEQLGMLKIDILGLKTLTIIDDSINLIKENHQYHVDLTKIPLDDTKVYKLLTDGKTIGIFQFESPGMQEYLKKIKPSVFEDMIAINALYRPGPLANNMADEFINRKNGNLAIEYLIPELEPILKETYGVILYQEQVMRIAGDIGGFKLSEADNLRKAMSKKRPEIMEKFGTKFCEGAKNRHIPAGKATALYEMMKKFGEYGFNKSHSACYALVAYYTAYLKVHYPVEFMAASLSSDLSKTDTGKITKYIEECISMGIKILPPDINHSHYPFTVEHHQIRFALGAIKTVGESAISSLVEARNHDHPFSSFFDFVSRTMIGGAVKKNTIEGLISAGALDQFGTRAQLLASTDPAITMAIRLNQRLTSAQFSLFGDTNQSQVNNGVSFELASLPELPLIEKLNKEKEFIGFYISGHPLDKYRFEMSCVTPIAELIELDREQTYVAGLITHIAFKTTRKNADRRLAFLTMEDYSGNREFTVFSDTISKYQPLLIENKMIVCQVTKNVYGDKVGYVVDRLFLLEDFNLHAQLQLRLDFQLNGLQKDTIDTVTGILEKYNGNVPVFLNLKMPFNGKSYFFQSKNFKVTPDSKLLMELKSTNNPVKAYYQIQSCAM